jgi:hypothetical protein
VVTFANWRSSLDPDLTQYAAMAALVAKWRTKACGDALPAWRSFDVVDFRGWFGFLLVSAHGDPNAPSCKLFGSRLPDLFAADFTSRHPAELFGVQRRTIGRAFAAHLALVSRERRICLAWFNSDPSPGAPDTKVLSLPMADALVLSAFDAGPAFGPPRFDPANAGLRD